MQSLTPESCFHFHAPTVGSSVISATFNLCARRGWSEYDFWHHSQFCDYYAWIFIKIHWQYTRVVKNLCISLDSKGEAVKCFNQWFFFMTLLTSGPYNVEFTWVSSDCVGSRPLSTQEPESQLQLWISHKRKYLSVCVSCTWQNIHFTLSKPSKAVWVFGCESIHSLCVCQLLFALNCLSAATWYAFKKKKTKRRGGNRMNLAVPGPKNVCCACILGTRSMWIWYELRKVCMLCVWILSRSLVNSSLAFTVWTPPLPLTLSLPAKWG